MSRQKMLYGIWPIELPCEEGEDFEGSVTELLCQSCSQTIVLSSHDKVGKCPHCGGSPNENMNELMRGVGK